VNLTIAVTYVAAEEVPPVPTHLNPLKYTPGELKVAIMQLVAIVVLVVGFFVVLDPSTTAKYQAVVAAVFSVIGVFAAKNPTPDSVNKSLTSLLTSVIAVVNLYSTVPTSTVEKIEMLIAVLVPPALVLFNRNAKKSEAEPARAAVA
jgi:hypothetical protein